MNEEIHFITNEGKWPGMNSKMMTPTFFKLYTVYIKKIRTISFHTLLTYRSVASYKYFKRLINEV